MLVAESDAPEMLARIAVNAPRPEELRICVAFRKTRDRARRLDPFFLGLPPQPRYSAFPMTLS